MHKMAWFHNFLDINCHNSSVKNTLLCFRKIPKLHKNSTFLEKKLPRNKYFCQESWFCRKINTITIEKYVKKMKNLPVVCANWRLRVVFTGHHILYWVVGCYTPCRSHKNCSPRNSWVMSRWLSAEHPKADSLVSPLHGQQPY